MGAGGDGGTGGRHSVHASARLAASLATRAASRAPASCPERSLARGGREPADTTWSQRRRARRCAGRGGRGPQARLTKGDRLPARHVIHTVGPIWSGGRLGEPELLAGCYRNSLAVARAAGLRRIAFPCISTGVYGYPAATACRLAVATVRADTAEKAGIDEVIFCCFSEEDLALYRDELALPG
jgi:O-acetyl-ADP-ribose deacetylase (regulator of RNase III)